MESSKINDLKGRIVSLEMELSILEQDIASVETDLCYLDVMQKDLNYNLDLLKKGEIVSVITAYKLSKDQLENVRLKTIELKNLKIKINNKINMVASSKKHYMDQFKQNDCEIENNVLKFRNNVLNFKKVQK